MKNIPLNILAIIALAMMFTISTASAADRVKVFEMGESGQTVEFPMTPEEIAAENRVNAVLPDTIRENSADPMKRLRAFEMGESGNMVSFPMTTAEIAAEDAAQAGLAAARTDMISMPDIQLEVFELAESG